jgi:hypothetical protein
VILRLFFARDQIFSKIHKTDKNFFLAKTKKLNNKQKNKCLIILNDKPNCQVSKILMNPRPIFLNRSENDPIADSALNLFKNFAFAKNERIFFHRTFALFITAS